MYNNETVSETCVEDLFQLKADCQYALDGYPTLFRVFPRCPKHMGVHYPTCRNQWLIQAYNNSEKK